jgi:phosphoglycolate phosphatase-like HAD superfamily hydrolase
MTHAVIFDIDGTLLNSSAEDDRMYREAVAQVLGDVRLRPTLSDYDPVTDTGILLQILKDNDIAEDIGRIADVKEAFFLRLKSFVDRHGPFGEVPGAKAVIGRLRASDRYQVAIATGGWRQSAEIKLKTAGFDIAAVPLATADDAIERTAIMQLALTSIGEEVTSVTYYGDGPWDSRACEILDWTFRAVGPALAGISSYDDEYAIKSSNT